MSLYDPENPQHLEYLSRFKAASRRYTIARNTIARTVTEGMAEAKKAARIHWQNKEDAK